MTSNRDIPFAKSIVDYIFRWLGMELLEGYRKANLPHREQTAAQKQSVKAAPEAVKDDVSSAYQQAGQASDTEAQRPLGSLLSPAPAGAFVGQDRANDGLASQRLAAKAVAESPAARLTERIDLQFSHYQEDAPACDVCGSITVRNGNCYKCFNCGSSLGCS